MQFLQRLFRRQQAFSPPGSNVPSPSATEIVQPEWMCDWRSLIASNQHLWNEAKRKPKLRLLLGTVAGGHPVALAVESLLAAALTLRGADVHALLCDGALPACLQCSRVQYSDMREFLLHGPKKLCTGCLQQGESVYAALGLPIRKLSDFITAEDKQRAAARASSFAIDSFVPQATDHQSLVQHIRSASMRFLTVGDVQADDDGTEVSRRYAEAAFLTQAAAARLFAQYQYDCYFSNHPSFVPHGVLKDIARQSNVKTMFWNPATRAGCVHLQHEDTAWDAVTRESPAIWERMDWTASSERDLMDYLSSKWTGARDWIYGDLHKDSERDARAIASEFGIDFNRKTIALLTNVVWDAAVFYPEAAFEDHTQWLVETIRYFSRRPELNLVIRVHPAEVRGTLMSTQTVESELAKYFDALAPNVFLIPASSKANTYALAEQCDAALIFATTTGLELTSMGIPTITAGESFIRHKGISYDATSALEYFQLLDRLPFGSRMSPDLLSRARKFAYHFNFRRTIPIKFLQPQQGWPPLKVDVASLDQLLPGEDPGLDIVCDAFFNFSAEIIYPAEKISTCGPVN
jgi:hypothetical protein